MTNPVIVTDADRKAASDYLRATSFDQKSERFHAEMLAGKRDVSLTVEAFARHRLAALDEAAEVAKAHNGASKRERQAKKHYLYAEDLAEIRAEERGEDIASSIIHANILALKETPDAK